MPYSNVNIIEKNLSIDGGSYMIKSISIMFFQFTLGSSIWLFI